MRLLLSIFSVCLGLALSAQEENKWELIKSKTDVTIYTKPQTCIVPSDAMNSDYQLFKIVNNNSFAVSVIFKIDKWYNGKCYTCDNKEYPPKVITLPANTHVEGECGRNQTESLKVYVKHNNATNNVVFTKFELTEFIVNSKL
jgi:hypothetical protein